MEAARNNRAHEAIKHSRRAERHVAKLVRLEPRNHLHHIVLAGIHYNRALFHEAAGDTRGALASIRQAVHLYTELDPSRGDAEAIRTIIRGNPGDRRALEQLIASAADARARLARMLAAYEGATAAEAVHHHGPAAIASYRELLKYGNDYGKSDLQRVQREYDEAKALLDRGAR
jgi:tetratricopeptide (TPR) repeat protein